MLPSSPLAWTHLLIATFLGGVWLSGRIYRIGILRYGSKVSWGQIFKWIRMKQ